MGLSIYKKQHILSRMLIKSWEKDAANKFDKIHPYLSKDEIILEVGTGLGTVSKNLTGKGYQVNGLDIKDYSVYPDIKPHIYDGITFPFKDKQFDTVLILTVLHHIKKPLEILKEAKRVGRRIIIIEDIYSTYIQQYLTYITDSITNFEFIGHPHTNCTDKAWKEHFKALGLVLINDFSYRYFLCYRQAVYVLES